MRVPSCRRAVGLGVVFLVASGVSPAAVSAGCTLNEEASAVKKSITREVRCNDKRFRKGPTAECSLSAPPACAGSLVDDAVALAYGPNNPPAARRRHAAACAISSTARSRSARPSRPTSARSSATSSTATTRGRRRGARADSSTSLPTSVSSRSSQDPSGVVAAGGRSAVRGGDPATPAAPSTPTALRDCLHTLLAGLGRSLRARTRSRCGRTSSSSSPTTSAGTRPTPRTRSAAPTSCRARAPSSRIAASSSPTAFMTTPLCCPSRASILTGQYAHRTGVYKNGGNNGGADDFDDALDDRRRGSQGAGYRTSLIGKYLNGYHAALDRTPSRRTCRPAGPSGAACRTSRFFDYAIVEPDGMGGYARGVLRQRRSRLLDRRAAREGEDLHHATRSPPASRSSSTSPSRRRTCRRSRRRATTASSRASRRGGRRATTSPTSPTSRRGCRTRRADAERSRRARPDPHRPARDAAGGRRGDRRQHDLRHHRHHGAPPQPRHRRRHASSSSSPTTAGTGASIGCARRTSRTRSRSARRCSCATRSSRRCRASRRASRSTSTSRRRSPSSPASGVPDRRRTARACVRVLDGTQPTLAHRLPHRGVAGQPPVGDRARGAVEVHRDPGDARRARARLRARALRSASTIPYEETNVASAPEHAARIANMATRLRQLRPNWPVDSDPNGPDPEEDE